MALLLRELYPYGRGLLLLCSGFCLCFLSHSSSDSAFQTIALCSLFYSHLHYLLLSGIYTGFLEVSYHKTKALRLCGHSLVRRSDSATSQSRTLKIIPDISVSRTIASLDIAYCQSLTLTTSLISQPIAWTPLLQFHSHVGYRAHTLWLIWNLPQTSED